MRPPNMTLLCILHRLRDAASLRIITGGVVATMLVVATFAMSADEAPRTPIMGSAQVAAARAEAAGAPMAARAEAAGAPMAARFAKMPGNGPGNAAFPRLEGIISATLVPANIALAKPFFFAGSESDREMAANCLSAAAWYEAGNDAAGQRAVIQVVLNRLKHPQFPKSVCAVVFQGSERTTGCQFTFTCDGSLARRVPSQRAWQQARARALAALNGAVDAAVMQATHYHADYVMPWWSSDLVMLSKIGAHIFYRWPGLQGRLSGRPVAGLEKDFALQGMALANARNLVHGNQPKPGTAAAASLVPASGVQPAELRDGAAVATVQPGAFFLAVDVNGPSGRWAMAALDQCASRRDCLAVSYGGNTVSLEAQAAYFAQQKRPLFLFVRDASSGMDLVLWDCDRVARPSSSQCLPDKREEVLSLMKPRPT